MLTRLLAEQNRRRFLPSLPHDDWRTDIVREAEASVLEVEWIETMRTQLPRVPEDFFPWFEELRASGPGQNDPLFPFLADHATREELRWFVAQEVAGEAGFDDLVALSQLALPERPKLEMARNYWDEMGRGAARGMHGPMLARTANELDVAGIRTIPEALDLANLMSALARHRRYAYCSIGALGVIELTAPTRTCFVQRGLERVGVSREGVQYFLLHTAVDVRHSREWNAEVIGPLIAEQPAAAQLIGEGALLRLEAGARCFAAYRAHFGLS